MKHIYHETETLTYHTGSAQCSGLDDDGEPRYAVDYTAQTIPITIDAYYDDALHVFVVDGYYLLEGERYGFRELRTVATEARAIRDAVAFADSIIQVAKDAAPRQELEEDIIDTYKAYLANGSSIVKPDFQLSAIRSITHAEYVPTHYGW